MASAQVMGAVSGAWVARVGKRMIAAMVMQMPMIRAMSD